MSISNSDELERLKRELEEVTAERDFLSAENVAYFKLPLIMQIQCSAPH
jgi:hypothetical protein